MTRGRGGSAGPWRPADGPLHPLVEAAGREGRLPEWAEASEERRAHLERVAELMGSWARAWDPGPGDRVRWRAAGLLHDALKDAAPRALRVWAGPEWPDALAHGPAAAARLRAAGVRDEELLLAVAHHSTGHPLLGSLGRCLYLADFLEPGRRRLAEERGRWREAMPQEMEEVLGGVTTLRLTGLLERGLPVLAVSLRFWNRLAEERAAGRAGDEPS